jgi:hypothetical protein
VADAQAPRLTNLRLLLLLLLLLPPPVLLLLLLPPPPVLLLVALLLHLDARSLQRVNREAFFAAFKSLNWST